MDSGFAMLCIALVDEFEAKERTAGCEIGQVEPWGISHEKLDS